MQPKSEIRLAFYLLPSRFLSGNRSSPGALQIHPCRFYPFQRSSTLYFGLPPSLLQGNSAFPYQAQPSDRDYHQPAIHAICRNHLSCEARELVSQIFLQCPQDYDRQPLPNRYQFQKRYPRQAIALVLHKHSAYPLYYETPTSGYECQTEARLIWQNDWLRYIS